MRVEIIRYRSQKVIGLLMLPVLLLFGGEATARQPDWRLYDQLLQEHVTAGQRQGISLNLVNYRNLAKDQRFSLLLKQLAEFRPAALEEGSEQLAFYINAYNILAISLIIDNRPLDSIRDIGSWFRPVWKRPAGVLGGREVSLDEIEHKVLRKMSEPRIHFAIVCASLSCPDLRPEAYRAEKLESQLEDQTIRFLSNSEKGVKASSEGIQVSKIFDWFAEDFEPTGAGAFVRRYLDVAGTGAVTGYLPYHWQLNGDS